MLKSQQVTSEIQALLDARFFDAPLHATVNGLAKKLGVNTRTVRKGLEPFVRRDILRAVKSKGIIRTDWSPSASRTLIGLVLRAEGHYFPQVVDAISAGLQRKNVFPLLINQSALERDRDHAGARLDDLMQHEPLTVMIDGDGFFAYPYLARCVGKRTVFLCSYDAPGDIPGAAVLIDFETGAALATRHLLELGHQRIVLVTHPPEDRVKDPVHRSRQDYYQLLWGYSRTMDEANLGERKRVLWHNREEEFRAMMKSADRPTAFVCSADFIAVKLMKWACSEGIRIPQDVSFTGCYDTPWVDYAPVPLSSLNMEIEKQADLAVDIALSEPWNKAVCKVCPRLVVRDSTGKCP